MNVDLDGPAPKTPVVGRQHFPPGDHRHGATGTLDVRVVRRGASDATIDLGLGPRRVITRAGDVMVSMPDRDTRFSIEAAREVTMLRIPGALAEARLKALEGALDTLRPLARKPMRDPLVAELCRRLDRFDGRPPVFMDAAIDTVLGLLLDRARRIAETDQIRPLSMKRVAAAQAALAADIGRSWSVDALAAVAGVPPRQFAASFREATGLPVRQYILRARVARAVELIEAGTETLTQVAERAGFSSQAHMHRTMTRLLGRTPGQVRAAGKRD